MSINESLHPHYVRFQIMTDKVYYTKYVIRRLSELESLNLSEHITEMTELMVQFLKQLTMVVESDVLLSLNYQVSSS